VKTPSMPFHDRTEAGQLLAGKLMAYANRHDTIVLALPRGGVPVGFEIAKVLKAPLDVFLVRKLGLPWQEELAMGATATGGIRVLNDDVIKAFAVKDEIIQAVAAKEEQELERRERLYRGDRPPVNVTGKIAILVDDGLATGSTMRAAVQALKLQSPARSIAAVPVAAVSICEELKHEVDEIVCAVTPEPFYAISQYYEDFSQTTDEEVNDLLSRASRADTQLPAHSHA
jgi:putative phosphoribosyl transferase